MRSLPLLFFGALGIAAPVATLAQAIHKCTAEDKTAYQSMPCAVGATDRIVVASRGPLADPLPVAARNRVPAAAGAPTLGNEVRRVFQRTSIALGMTDDEVLNLASWGRPSAITRSRSNRIWHEEWVYRWRSGGMSRLSFANGRLAEMQTAAAQAESPVNITLR